MLKVHITSDERGEGKTVLASYLVDFLNGLGHRVKFESTSSNERLYFPDGDLVSKDIVVSTDNSHLPFGRIIEEEEWYLGKDLGHFRLLEDDVPSKAHE